MVPRHAKLWIVHFLFRNESAKLVYFDYHLLRLVTIRTQIIQNYFRRII